MGQPKKKGGRVTPKGSQVCPQTGRAHRFRTRKKTRPASSLNHNDPNDNEWSPVVISCSWCGKEKK